MNNGSSYNGEFYQGKMTGVGEYIMANGDVYQGKLDNNLRHGYGRYIWNSGEFFIGVFDKGEMVKGVYTSIDGETHNIDLL